MRMFDVNELEDRITEVLQSMQETGETIAVTKGGEVIAHLVPASKPQWLAKVPGDDLWANFDRISADIDTYRSETMSAVDDLRTAWANFDRLVAELGVQWPEGVNAVDAVRDVRYDGYPF
jgi:antitoxin (DNA-binding transcriptional repressor) of toxin-antitoxin stability system